MRKINRVIYHLWHDRSKTGRVGYIGKDSYWPSRSCLKNRAKDKEQPKLYNAFKKYPFQIWHIDVIARGFRSGDALNQAEIKFIAKFNSKKKGYNCTDGGDGVAGWHHSKASRKKMSKAKKGNKNARGRKGFKASEETKKRLSQAQMGNQNRKGCKASKETRKKLSIARIGNQNRKGYKSSEETKRTISRGLRKWWKNRRG